AWRTSWPDERLVRTTVGGIPDALAELEATTTVLVLVGDAVGGGDPPARSHVYDPRYTHSFRDGDGG
ncbi:MAG: cobalt-precorrin-4 C(11)-methyltransferase, partial [Acidimicrobiia bacterium]